MESKRLVVDNFEISDASTCYVIAEIGHNHQGNLQKIKDLFKDAKECDVNISSFLEASVLNKPCITIVTEDFKETQQLPHFSHLTDAGFLETANRSGEVVAIVQKIINGVDVRASQHHEFVKKFLSLVDNPL